MSSTNSTSSVQFLKRPSEERGGANHGWLKTFHTFSFADYFDSRYNQFGSLRVINEDRVEPHTGFGTHPHREFEIFSYIVSGELQHNDSLGNKEVLKRGDLQMTSTGTGIRHSEHAHGDKQVHFLQIWAIPYERGLKPQYYTRHFTDEEKTNKWAHIVAPASLAPSGSVPNLSLDREAPTGPAPVHSPLHLFASLISPGVSLHYTLTPSPPTPTPVPQQQEGQRKMYIHVVQTSGYNPGKAKGHVVKVSSKEANVAEGVELKEGDGLIVVGAVGKEVSVENVGEGMAEVLLFEMD